MADTDLPSAEDLLADSALEVPGYSDDGPLVGLVRTLRRISLVKTAIFLASLFLFTLAITLMKDGARGMAPLVRDGFQISTPYNSLGFGWLFAYVVMSGSPVAAAALAFLDTGLITGLQTFTMISGSRLGANFIVLGLGFLYILRGRNRATSLSMGLLSFWVTGSTHVIALFIGAALLVNGSLGAVNLQAGALLTSITDRVFDPITAALSGFLPDWALFPLGLGIILVSFNLFDRCLPQMAIKESHVGAVSRLVYRPLVMFLLGAGVTLISMSVSVSLSILVPLSNRGFVRRENVIPYIMGANITTFIDTLLAAVLLNNPQAVSVVLVGMVSITLVSLVILLTIYRRYERWMLAIAQWITADARHLTLFMAAIFLIPIVLLLI